MGMEAQQKDGSTLRSHLERTVGSPFASIERIEEAKKALVGPPFPVLGGYLIEMWRRAQRSRENNGFGFVPINYRAWAKDRSMHLEGFEIETLEALDDLVASKRAEQDSDLDSGSPKEGTK